MARKVEDADLDGWEIPPLSPEVQERLRAAGVRPPTGSFDDWSFEPIRQRPRWLAFLLRRTPQRVTDWLEGENEETVPNPPCASIEPERPPDFRYAEDLTREELDERMRVAGIRPSTASLAGKPRNPEPLRPRWRAFLHRLLHI